VGEVQLVESEVVEEVDNDNNTYWLVNITLNDDGRIEFEAGDVIGYYQPPDTRYLVWTIAATGYIAYFYSLGTPLSTIFLGSREIFFSNWQPLIQFTYGMEK